MWLFSRTIAQSTYSYQYLWPWPVYCPFIFYVFEACEIWLILKTENGTSYTSKKQERSYRIAAISITPHNLERRAMASSWYHVSITVLVSSRTLSQLSWSLIDTLREGPTVSPSYCPYKSMWDLAPNLVSEAIAPYASPPLLHPFSRLRQTSQHADALVALKNWQLMNRWSTVSASVLSMHIGSMVLEKESSLDVIKTSFDFVKTTPSWPSHSRNQTLFWNFTTPCLLPLSTLHHLP